MTIHVIRVINHPMIKSFKCKDTEELYNKEFSKKFPRTILQRAFRKLEIFDSANSSEVLRSIPGNYFEVLKGDRKGQFSIRINDQYRICFIWENGDAYEVEIVDYHK